MMKGHNEMTKMVITKDMSPEQRMAALKKEVRKFNKKMRKNAAVRRDETSFMDKYSDDNIHHWTDAPKYVNEYYGDRARDQEGYESYEGWN